MIELVFPPQIEIVLLRNLEAREKRESEGEKTVAHLAAMRVIWFLMARCFRLKARRIVVAGFSATGYFRAVDFRCRRTCRSKGGDRIPEYCSPE